MSWTTSQYDENPFSDNNSASTTHSKEPAKKAPTLETPPWLQESAQIQAPTISASPRAIASPAEMDPSVPRMILYTRVINLILSVCMIVVSLLSLLTTQTATTGVLACYVVVFSCLLCCFETHLKQVSKFIALNFGFMYSAKARSVFMLFIGTILFSFSLFGKLIGLLMVANAFFNAFILVKYPQYEDAQRSDATSEIKDYLSSHPAFAKSVFDTSLKVGTDIIKSNPEMARQGAEALLSSASSNSSRPSSQQYRQQDDDRGSYAQV